MLLKGTASRRKARQWGRTGWGWWGRSKVLNASDLMGGFIGLGPARRNRRRNGEKLCFWEAGVRKGEYWKERKLEGDFRLWLEFLFPSWEESKPFPLMMAKHTVNLQIQGLVWDEITKEIGTSG